jgi:hypothetical protein
MKLSISKAFHKQDNTPYSPPHNAPSATPHFSMLFISKLYEGQALTRDCLLERNKDSFSTANLEKPRKLSSLAIGQIGDPGLNGRKV